jgi:hypothetical protein
MFVLAETIFFQCNMLISSQQLGIQKKTEKIKAASYKELVKKK